MRHQFSRVSFENEVRRCVLALGRLAVFAVGFLPSIAAAQAWPPKESCETPLIAAIHQNNLEEAARIIKSGVNLNVRCGGSTALIEAIVRDQIQVINELVLAGASLRVTDNKKTSPLMIASWYCREEVVALLLAHGADVNAIDEDGYSPLMHSSQNCQDAKVPALLLRFGARVGTRGKNGDSALRISSFYGNEQVVHLLVAAGADIGAKIENGETALTIARDRDGGRKESHDRIYQYLLQATEIDKTRAKLQKAQ